MPCPPAKYSGAWLRISPIEAHWPSSPLTCTGEQLARSLSFMMNAGWSMPRGPVAVLLHGHVQRRPGRRLDHLAQPVGVDAVDERGAGVGHHRRPQAGP